MAKDYHAQGEKDAAADRNEKRNIVQEIGSQIFGGKYNPPSDPKDADDYKQGWKNAKK